jgi:drug/metabolite transporter (DMT)-like permease
MQAVAPARLSRPSPAVVAVALFFILLWSSSFIAPIFGIGLAALLLGEPFSVRDGLGLGAVAAGIFLISRPVISRE